MHREGHLGAALLAYTPLGAAALAVGQVIPAALGAVVTVALASVPDYDHRIPGISHRGITHTVWFAAAVAALVGGLAAAFVGLESPDARLAGGFGALVGAVAVLSHVAADAITPMGVTPFVPLSDRHYTLDLVRADNTVANYLLLTAGVAAAAVAFLVTSRVAAG
ncbi:MAG: metal-dependent hydrolase [Halobaculum sp.]